MSEPSRPEDRANSCIYCGEVEPARFESREHVIPQAFGHFGSQTPVLKCVCDVCNALFGRELDQVHARDTLEGVLRYKQGIKSRENRPQRRLKFTLADEAESGSLLGAAVDGVDPTSDELRPLATQLQILNLKTGKTDIFTRRQLGQFDLPEDVYGTSGERRLNIYAPSKAEHDAFLEELNRAGFDMRMEGVSIFDINPSVEDDGKATIGVHIEGVFDQLHRRCIAKLLINFAAFYLGDAEVRTHLWDPVKRFVRYGEGELGARLSDRPFWGAQETDNLRWPDAINVRLENHKRGIVGSVQFYNRITYELLLVEGHKLSSEVAARFDNGREPDFGFRLVLT